MSQLSETAVSVLQDIRDLDPEAFAALVSFRAKANDKLAAHPTIQVTPGKSQMTFLGVINGILGAANEAKIAAIVDNDTVVGFTILENPSKSTKP